MYFSTLHVNLVFSWPKIDVNILLIYLLNEFEDIRRRNRDIDYNCIWCKVDKNLFSLQLMVFIYFYTFTNHTRTT